MCLTFTRAVADIGIFFLHYSIFLPSFNLFFIISNANIAAVLEQGVQGVDSSHLFKKGMYEFLYVVSQQWEWHSVALYTTRCIQLTDDCLILAVRSYTATQKFS